MVIKADDTVVANFTVVSFRFSEYFTCFAVPVVVELCLLVYLCLSFNELFWVEDLLFSFIQRDERIILVELLIKYRCAQFFA